TSAGPVVDAADLRARTLARLQDRALLQASVEQCRFDGPDAQRRVTVTLHSDRKMHQDRLRSPVIQQELTQVVRAVAGGDVQVEFRFATADAAAPAAAPAEPGPTAKRVIGRFAGRVVQVDPEERRRAPPSAGGDEPAAPEPPPEPGD
ncbi:MAG: hypothetical protein KF830_11770, partial [Planctomycetes bacterium]|nr:hypothetical protein [Planctomycetota bacterium]